MEKEWCSFGHKFAQRCTPRDAALKAARSAETGNWSAPHPGFNLWDEHEFSPVFLQFLDAAWQLWRQFPTRFEYNEVWGRSLAFEVCVAARTYTQYCSVF